jgi:hypothetical protein
VDAKKAFLGDSDRRALETLKMLRDEVIKAAFVQGGPSAGYWEPVGVATGPYLMKLGKGV